MDIANYSIQSELGRGGMATVYLAHDNKFDTNVAVKVLHKELVHNDNIRKRFLAEARNMFKMSHPNIIKVTDLIDEGTTVAFVMEYIDGETLKDYIDRKGKLSDEEIKKIFTPMLEALVYVHELNLVHRDIKPSNFMLDKKGKVKLLDFGIAKNLVVESSDYTHTGINQNMGTPMYMSPEQITETKSVTEQSDIYSLGVVLWQMVTGQKPYDVRTLTSFNLHNKIVNENLLITSSIFESVIQKATRKLPEQRFQNIEAFINAVNHSGKNKFLEQTILETKMEDDENTEVIQSEENSNPFMKGRAFYGGSIDELDEYIEVIIDSYNGNLKGGVFNRKLDYFINRNKGFRLEDVDVFVECFPEEIRDKVTVISLYVKQKGFFSTRTLWVVFASYGEINSNTIGSNLIGIYDGERSWSFTFSVWIDECLELGSITSIDVINDQLRIESYRYLDEESNETESYFDEISLDSDLCNVVKRVWTYIDEGGLI